MSDFSYLFDAIECSVTLVAHVKIAAGLLPFRKILKISVSSIVLSIGIAKKLAIQVGFPECAIELIVVLAKSLIFLNEPENNYSAPNTCFHMIDLSLIDKYMLLHKYIQKHSISSIPLLRKVIANKINLSELHLKHVILLSIREIMLRMKMRMKSELLVHNIVNNVNDNSCNGNNSNDIFILNSLWNKQNFPFGIQLRRLLREEQMIPTSFQRCSIHTMDNKNNDERMNAIVAVPAGSMVIYLQYLDIELWCCLLAGASVNMAIGISVACGHWVSSHTPHLAPLHLGKGNDFFNDFFPSWNVDNMITFLKCLVHVILLSSRHRHVFQSPYLTRKISSSPSAGNTGGHIELDLRAVPEMNLCNCSQFGASLEAEIVKWNSVLSSTKMLTAEQFYSVEQLIKFYESVSNLLAHGQNEGLKMNTNHNDEFDGSIKDVQVDSDYHYQLVWHRCIQVFMLVVCDVTCTRYLLTPHYGRSESEEASFATSSHCSQSINPAPSPATAVVLQEDLSECIAQWVSQWRRGDFAVAFCPIIENPGVKLLQHMSTKESEDLDIYFIEDCNAIDHVMSRDEGRKNDMSLKSPYEQMHYSNTNEKSGDWTQPARSHRVKTHTQQQEALCSDRQARSMCRLIYSYFYHDEVIEDGKCDVVSDANCVKVSDDDPVNINNLSLRCNTSSFQNNGVDFRDVNCVNNILSMQTLHHHLQCVFHEQLLYIQTCYKRNFVSSITSFVELVKRIFQLSNDCINHIMVSKAWNCCYYRTSFKRQQKYQQQQRTRYVASTHQLQRGGRPSAAHVNTVNDAGAVSFKLQIKHLFATDLLHSRCEFHDHIKQYCLKELRRHDIDLSSSMFKLLLEKYTWFILLARLSTEPVLRFPTSCNVGSMYALSSAYTDYIDVHISCSSTKNGNSSKETKSAQRHDDLKGSDNESDASTMSICTLLVPPLIACARPRDRHSSQIASYDPIVVKGIALTSVVYCNHLMVAKLN